MKKKIYSVVADNYDGSCASPKIVKNFLDAKRAEELAFLIKEYAFNRISVVESEIEEEDNDL